MNRDTSFKPIKVNGPGTTGARVYGLVKIGFSIEDLIEGRIDEPLIQKPNGEWVKDEELLEMVLIREMGRLVATGVEKADGKHWDFSIYAVPRELLRGREDLVREWVREWELPSKPIDVEAGTRSIKHVLPDGTIKIEFQDYDEEEKEK